jgi:hypothetical protein
MDGSPVTEVPVELEGASDPAVLTKARVVGVAEVEQGSLAAGCLRAVGPDSLPSAPLVERVGVASETVTFRSRSGLHACEDAPGPREQGRRWCGNAFSRPYDRRLRDPSLDIAGCRTEEGDILGFAWVEPHAAARYLAVGQPSYTEVYETAGGLPVRIATTSGVEVEGSRASFELSEHDAEGKLLRRYRLQAAVAG